MAASPTISTSSPTFTAPRSIRPVTTVPRPEIENTSSIGIRNGRFTARSGCGMYASTAAIRSRIDCRPIASSRPSRAARAEPLTIGMSSPGNSYLREQLAHLELDQLQELRVVDHVDLVHVDDQRRHAHLPRQQDVLARLRHRPVGRRDHQDGAVHLRRTGDHVLHVVGVARAVDMRVVPVLGLVLDVRGVDRDPARLLLRRLVDLVVGRELRPTRLRADLRDRRRQRRLAMVDVTDRADVRMRLRPRKLLLGHRRLLSSALASCGAWGSGQVRRRPMERVRGIEPPPPAWKAGALPLSYTRRRVFVSPPRLAMDGGGGRIRTYVDVRRQIYSLLPLTTRPPLRAMGPEAETPRRDIGIGSTCQHQPPAAATAYRTAGATVPSRPRAMSASGAGTPCWRPSPTRTGPASASAAPPPPWPSSAPPPTGPDSVRETAEPRELDRWSRPTARTRAWSSRPAPCPPAQPASSAPIPTGRRLSWPSTR